jgi:hypothetical protein
MSSWRLAGRAPHARAGSSTYNPQSLLSAVCCHAPVFRGKQQHDAHELMRMLLDGLQCQEQRYRDISKRGRSKQQLVATVAADADADNAAGSDVQAAAAAAASRHSLSSSSSSSDGAASDAASERAGDEASTADGDTAANGAEPSGGSSSDGDADTDQTAAAAAGEGLAQLCRSYLDRSSKAGGRAEEAASDHAGSSSSSDEADTSLHSTAPSNAEIESGFSQQQQGLQNGHNPSSSTQDQPTACAAGSDAQHTLCSECGTTLQEQQQQQQPLVRKSLLPPVPPTSAGSSSVDAVFGGVLCSCITCTACGHCSVSYEPFLDLSLPIPLDVAPQQQARKVSKAVGCKGDWGLHAARLESA